MTMLTAECGFLKAVSEMTRPRSLHQDSKYFQFTPDIIIESISSRRFDAQDLHFLTVIE